MGEVRPGRHFLGGGGKIKGILKSLVRQMYFEGEKF